MYCIGMCSIILNSNNRINKSNTNANDCEYNFDWRSVLDERKKYKVSYNLSKFFITPPSPFQSLISAKIPWGLYKASSYNSVTQILPDDSGNDRNASCGAVNLVTSPSGNRNSIPVKALSGLKLSNIFFPIGSIPSTHTICCLTRYTNPLVMGRLLAGASSDNYNFGAYRGSQPTIYEGVANIEACNNNAGLVNSSTNWLNVCCIRGNTVTVPNNVLINAIPSGSNYLPGTTSGRLAINGYYDSSDHGEFEFGCLIVWDQYLTASELVIVSNAIENYLTTGILI
jgi:hypothetical protein